VSAGEAEWAATFLVIWRRITGFKLKIITNSKRDVGTLFKMNYNIVKKPNEKITLDQIAKRPHCMSPIIV